jgi:hypothetical protein
MQALGPITSERCNKMRYVLTIVFGLIITIGRCCDCHSSLLKPFQKTDYDNAELIFLVQIRQEIDSGVFEVKLIESFKGEFRPMTKVLNITNAFCSRSVSAGRYWLIYSINKGDKIVIDECSRSRDIEKTRYWIPPPPQSGDKKRDRKAYDKYNKSDKGDIADELKQLRQLKAGR